MKILLVENDLEDIEAVVEALGDIDDIEIAFAESRDSAVNALHAGQFDVIVCDLKIPAQDGGLDDETEHGLAVVGEAVDCSAGTPILILSAFGTTDTIVPLMRTAGREDAFGTRGAVCLIDHIRKGMLPDAIDRLAKYANETRQVDRIELVLDAETAAYLGPYHRRVLRLFARRFDGRVVRVRKLGGGFSGARTVQCTVSDSSGMVRARSVAKVSDLRNAADEKRRFEEYVNPLVRQEAFTPHLGDVRAGAAGLGGVFYRIAEGYDRTLFDLVAADEGAAAGVARALHEIERAWVGGAPTRQADLGDLRRRVVADDTMTEWGARFLMDVGWRRAEELPLQIREGFQHGDLHGMNVLVDGAQRPMIVDYGEVGVSMSTIDPITLELSLLFHPAGRRAMGHWPPPEVARRWSELDRYLAACPAAAFVRECRTWATEMAAGARDVYAAAYLCALRQFRYDDTDKGLAAAVVASAVEAFGRT